ncbi:Histidine kinase [Marinobacter salarius]|jgi:signal transduction histidine kinase/ActR/RegA family two-component response regulator|uniref:ATP-binding protein n=1 Tax=Marinobacter salarius TaxID=1420917 RepID=UPI001258A356|nr:ATP-binding protein [Marinobacter salarius]MCZ4286811.1 ATP-binding protein [Marinobacter salarius]VVS98616.1 Histidine kinase [Marinobacter salarius]VXC38347.1 Histidine kinase [Marinobacter salarius]
MSKRMGRPVSLTRKLLLLGAAPAIVMFIVLMVFFTSARLDDARKDLADSSQMLADSLAPAVEYAVVSGNTASLEQILSQSLRRSRAQWIRVSNVVGEEVGFVSTDDPGNISAEETFDVFESEILQQPLDLGEDRQTEWFEPNYGFGSGALRVGTVQVGVNKAQLAARRQDILWTSLAVGFSLLLFTLLIVKHSLNSIVSPIHGLSRRVAKLINREYEEVEVGLAGATRETRELEESLNALSRHLRNLKASRDETLASSEKARERAEMANRAKSEFLATMSHELRTPLNGVLGMIELVTDEALSARQKDYLQTARQSTEDLLTVINDILDYSHIDRGTLELDNREFDLKELITNCTASYRHVAEQQGLALSTKFIGDWPDRLLVLGDSPRLRQILAGLIDNAIKFTGDGFIKVQASFFSLEDNCLVLNCTVSDSGCGIPVERIHDIFNSFEQLDTGDSRSYGGTGMGLSLVQRLVELMGGHVKVETDIGKGSQFRFELPFELANRVDHVEAAEQGPVKTGGEQARALVVEDNMVNQRVATALLRRLGFETDAAANGEEALDLVRTNHSGYDVILMDCQMPVMDGYETTRCIREWEKSNGQGGTPIIALTADALPGTETSCREAGMNDYLAKPVRKEHLRTVLSRWIRV